MEETFETKDSGARQQFDSGMVRDTQDGKNRLDLALDGPLPLALFVDGPKSDAISAFIAWYTNARENFVDMEAAVRVVKLVANYEGGISELFSRYAALMTRGAVKYSARNWMQADGQAEYERFVSSACRHFFQWVKGDRDEDHAAAVIFNLNGAAYVRGKIDAREAQQRFESVRRGAF